MMGPIGIAQASSNAARAASAPTFLIAIISLQVGLLNLFPWPASTADTWRSSVSEG